MITWKPSFLVWEHTLIPPLFHLPLRADSFAKRRRSRFHRFMMSIHSAVFRLSFGFTVEIQSWSSTWLCLRALVVLLFHHERIRRGWRSWALSLESNVTNQSNDRCRIISDSVVLLEPSLMSLIIVLCLLFLDDSFLYRVINPAFDQRLHNRIHYHEFVVFLVNHDRMEWDWWSRVL